MTPEITRLKHLERLLAERRKHFIASNARTKRHCDDPCFLLTGEKLLFHYDQLIAIVRQAILFGAYISTDSRRELISFLDEQEVRLGE